jgi:hypothetical protein
MAPQYLVSIPERYFYYTYLGVGIIQKKSEYVRNFEEHPSKKIHPIGLF